MAEGIVSAVVGEAVSRVISLVAGSYFGSRRSTEEAKLQSVCRLLVRIRSVVEEAKARQIENQGVLQWLSELIDGEYEGRYLLDTVGCGEPELEDDDDDEKKKGGCSDNNNEVAPLHQSASSLSLFNPAKRVRVAAACAVKCALSRRRRAAVVGAGDDGEIDRVLATLQGASGDLAEFIALMQGYQRRIRRPLATNIFLDGQMFGRHVEEERIVSFLLHDDDGGGSTAGPPRLGVLPVVGDIGVGKTTLVQHACDDPRVRDRFPVIVLFNFSCTYAIGMSEATVVLRSKHVIGDDAAGVNVKDPLELIEKGNFGNKRFLMVFEDVDMRKKRMLEELLRSLMMRCGIKKKGSKIIFTTNNRRVASGIGTVEPIMLKFLPHPEYWFFFKAHAFAGRDLEENNPRLVAAGKAIARKLNRSFFGAKIVGGLLKDHPDPKFWCKVLRSNIGGLSLLGDGIAYVADLAETLLPKNVSMCNVIVSKDRYSSQVELARFRDLLCDEPRRGSEATCMADDVAFARVVLCKSVLPFVNHYYIASCTIDSDQNRCSELVAGV